MPRGRQIAEPAALRLLPEHCEDVSVQAPMPEPARGAAGYLGHARKQVSLITMPVLRLEDAAAFPDVMPVDHGEAAGGRNGEHTNRFWLVAKFRLEKRIQPGAEIFSESRKPDPEAQRENCRKRESQQRGRARCQHGQQHDQDGCCCDHDYRTAAAAAGCAARRAAWSASILSSCILKLICVVPFFTLAETGISTSWPTL
jgi:hypothetical protein